MAKKKMSHHQPHDHKLHDAPHPPQIHPDRSHSHQSSNMDDPSDQLKNLKNLNSRLLKETTERRKQVESLIHDKEALESAFNRSAVEKRDLEFQLSEAVEDNVGLDLEKALAFAYVQTQVREMGFRFDRLAAQRNEIECVKTEREAEIALLKGELSKLTARLEKERDQLSRLSRERDDLKVHFDGLVDEANRLKEKVIEAEKAESELQNEVEKLSKEAEKLRGEKDEKEGAIRELTTERDFALRKSAESARVIEELKGEIDGIKRDKCETEEQKHAQELKIIDLELELKKLDETLKKSLKEEVFMRNNILEYEKSLAQALDKVKNMEMEIDALRKEIKENEQSIKMLTERRDGIQKILDKVQKEVEDKQHTIDEAIRGEKEIEQVRVGLENEIVELNREVDQLKNTVHKWEASCRDLEEKNRQLISEVDRRRITADEAISERDSVRKGFDEEKNKVMSLILEVAGMKDKIEQTAAELGDMSSEREKLIQSKEMMENRVTTLTKEKDELQKNLVDAERNCDDLRAKVECSNQTLALLKNTAALVCHSKNEKEGEEEEEEEEEEVVSIENLDEEFVPYAEELVAIKKAFRNKNKMVEEMKQQLVSLQNSAAEAQKRKGFWTVISSATTILAAALAAYVARAR